MEPKTYYKVLKEVEARVQEKARHQEVINKIDSLMHDLDVQTVQLGMIMETLGITTHNTEVREEKTLNDTSYIQ